MRTQLQKRTKKVYRGHQHPSYRSLPIILLKGLYLSKIGFQIGDTINIELSTDCILITKQSRNQTTKNV